LRADLRSGEQHQAKADEEDSEFHQCSSISW
jgi:hypothetical protein